MAESSELRPKVITRTYQPEFQVDIELKEAPAPQNTSTLLIRCNSEQNFFCWCFILENDILANKLQQRLEKQNITLMKSAYPPKILVEGKELPLNIDVIIQSSFSEICKNRGLTIFKIKKKGVCSFKHLLTEVQHIKENTVVIYHDNESYIITGKMAAVNDVHLWISDHEIKCDITKQKTVIKPEDQMKYVDDSDDEASTAPERCQKDLSTNAVGRRGIGEVHSVQTSGSNGAHDPQHNKNLDKQPNIPSNIQQTASKDNINTEKDKRFSESVLTKETSGTAVSAHGVASNVDCHGSKNESQKQNLGCAKSTMTSDKKQAIASYIEETTRNKDNIEKERSQRMVSGTGVEENSPATDGRHSAKIILNGIQIELYNRCHVLANALNGIGSAPSCSLHENIIEIKGEKFVVGTVAGRIEQQLSALMKSDHFLTVEELPQEVLNMMQYDDVMEFVYSALSKEKLSCYLQCLGKKSDVTLKIYAANVDVAVIRKTIKSCFSDHQIDITRDWKYFLQDKTVKAQLDHLRERYKHKVMFLPEENTLRIFSTSDIIKGIYTSLKKHQENYLQESVKPVTATFHQAFLCNTNLQNEIKEIEKNYHVTIDTKPKHDAITWEIKGPKGLVDQAYADFTENILKAIYEEEIQLDNESRAFKELFHTKAGDEKLKKLEKNYKCGVVKEYPTETGLQRKEKVWPKMNGKRWSLADNRVFGIYCGDVMLSGCDVVVIPEPERNVPLSNRGIGHAAGSQNVVKLPIPPYSQNERHIKAKLAEVFRQLFNKLHHDKHKSVAISLDTQNSIGWPEKKFLKEWLCEFIDINGELDTCLVFNQEVRTFETTKASMTKFFDAMSEKKEGVIVSITEDVMKDKRTVDIILKRGNLHIIAQEEKCDIVVNTTSFSLDLSKGAVSSSILFAAGQEVQTECDKKFPDGIASGDVAVTKGHDMSCAYIFHGSFEIYSKDMTLKGMKQFMLKCLRIADEKKMSSIAFPAIGTGNLNYPRQKVAFEMYDTVKKYMMSVAASSVQKIYFVIYQADKATYQEFLQEQQKYDSTTSTFFKTTEPDRKDGLQLSYGKINFRVTRGNVEEQKADALLILWNSGEPHNYPKRKAYLKSAGQVVEDEWKKKRTLFLSKDKKLTTGGGMLSCMQIFHKIIDGSLDSNILEAFDWMIKSSGVKSIVIPFQAKHDEITSRTDAFVNAIDKTMKIFAKESAISLQSVDVVVDTVDLYKKFKEKVKTLSPQLVISDTDDQVPGAVGGDNKASQQPTKGQLLSTFHNPKISTPRLVIVGLEQNVKQALQILKEMVDSLNQNESDGSQYPNSKNSQKETNSHLPKERITAEAGLKIQSPPEEQVIDRGRGDTQESDDKFKNGYAASSNEETAYGIRTDVTRKKKNEEPKADFKEEGSALKDPQTGSTIASDQRENMDMNNGSTREENDHGNNLKPAENKGMGDSTNLGDEDNWVFVSENDLDQNTETTSDRVQPHKLEHERRRLIFRAAKTTLLQETEVEKELSKWLFCIEVIVCPFWNPNEALLVCKSTAAAQKLMNEFNNKRYQLMGFPMQMVINLKAALSSTVVQNAKIYGCLALLKDVYKKSGAQFQEKGSEAWIEGSILEIQLGSKYIAGVVQSKSLLQEVRQDDKNHTDIKADGIGKDMIPTKRSFEMTGESNIRCQNSGQNMVEISREDYDAIDFFESKCLNGVKPEWSENKQFVRLYNGDTTAVLEARNRIKMFDVCDIPDVTDVEMNRMQDCIALLKRDNIRCYKLPHDSKVHIQGGNKSKLVDAKRQLLEAIGRNLPNQKGIKSGVVHTADTPVENQDTTHKDGQGMPKQLVDVVQPDRSKGIIINNVSVYVYEGNILNLPVDCIVNAANPKLHLNSGISLVIAKAAGPEFEEQCKAVIEEIDMLQVGDSCVTGAGTLRYMNVIHTRGPSWSFFKTHGDDKIQECKNGIASAIFGCLQKVHNKNLKSVGIPAISSGKFGVPLDLCAAAYAQGVHHFVNKHPHSSIEDIHFVLLDRNDADLVRQIFTKFSGEKPALQSGAVAYSKQGARPKTTLHQSVTQSQIKYPYVSPHQNYGTYFLTDVMSVIVYDADITKVNCDIIVNFVDTQFKSLCPFGTSLEQKAGALYKQDLAKLKGKEIEFRTEIVHQTGAGALRPAKNVLHAVIIEDILEGKPDVKITYLSMLYIKILFKAAQMTVTSVALPYLDFENFNIADRKGMAKQLKDVIVEFANQHNSGSKLRSIHIVNRDKSYSQLMKETFDDYIKQIGGRTGMIESIV